MLVATALVLLMTPGARVLLRRAGALEERAEHHDDELRRARRRRRRVGARRLLAGLRRRQRRHRRPRLTLFLRGVGLEAQGHDPAPPLHGLPGDVRDHHRRARSRARSSSACASARTWSSSSLWTPVVYAPVAHWVWGGRLARAAWARSTSPAAPSCTSTPASPALVAALVLGPRRDYGRQAILPHNVPFVAARRRPALVRLVRLQRRQRARRQRRGGARLRQHDARARGDARGLDARSTCARTGRSTAVGAATAIVVGLVAITPAAGFVGPLGALAIGALAALPSYFGILLRAAHPPRRLARRGRARTASAASVGALADRRLRAARPGAARRRPARRQRRRSCGIQAIAVVATIALQRRRHLRPAQGCSALVVPLRAAATRRRRWASTSTQHGEEAYAQRRGRHPGAADDAAPAPRHAVDPSGGTPATERRPAHEADHCHHPTREAQRRARGAVPRRGRGLTDHARAGARRRDRARSRPTAAPRSRWSSSRRCASRSASRTPSSTSTVDAILRGRPHRRGRRRQDLRPARREGRTASAPERRTSPRSPRCPRRGRGRPRGPKVPGRSSLRGSRIRRRAALP